VLYVSTHRFGRGFYPGTGHPSEVGSGHPPQATLQLPLTQPFGRHARCAPTAQVGVGAGEGTSVNVAFRGTGYGDREFMHAFDRCIMPIAREYGPELVVVSAGFDAAAGDPLGGMALSPAGYAHMTAQLQARHARALPCHADRMSRVPSHPPQLPCTSRWSGWPLPPTQPLGALTHAHHVPHLRGRSLGAALPRVRSLGARSKDA
jgi:acetoin utilization deacetylase AcuC-like enzyme